VDSHLRVMRKRPHDGTRPATWSHACGDTWASRLGPPHDHVAGRRRRRAVRRRRGLGCTVRGMRRFRHGGPQREGDDDWHAPRPAAASHRPRDAGIPNHRGKPLEPKAFASTYWYGCLRALEIGVREIYATKDTFVTTALKAGVKVAWLEAQTGVGYATLKRHYGGGSTMATTPNCAASRHRLILLLQLGEPVCAPGSPLRAWHGPRASDTLDRADRQGLVVDA
jgi:hypothetical protein